MIILLLLPPPQKLRHNSFMPLDPPVLNSRIFFSLLLKISSSISSFPIIALPVWNPLLIQLATVSCCMVDQVLHTLLLLKKFDFFFSLVF